MAESLLALARSLAERAALARREGDSAVGAREAEIVVEPFEHHGGFAGQRLELDRVAVATDSGALEAHVPLDLLVSGSARGLECVFEHLGRALWIAGDPERPSEVELGASAYALVGDAQLASGREPLGRILEGERCRRLFGGAQVVMDRSLDASEGSGDRKMMSELGNDALGIDAVHSLESFTDAEVELGAADAGESVVQGAPHELVGKAV